MKYIIEIKKIGNIKRNAKAVVSVPGSKSITNRALLLAAMGDGKSYIKGAQTSDDAKYFLEAIKTLGFEISEEKDKLSSNLNLHIRGLGGDIPKKKEEIYVGSAGTAARFLCAMLSFSDGEYTINASEQMKSRPMAPLITSLKSTGAEITCLEKEGYLPLIIKGAGKKQKNNTIKVDIKKSSQFLSALLIAAAASKKDITIEAEGDHGMDYVYMTIRMIKVFGVDVISSESGSVKRFQIHSEGVRATDYAIEPDMSAAAYFYAMAAITNSSVTVRGIKTPSLQGDIKFLDVLEKMGAKVTNTPDGITVKGSLLPLKGGFSVDMGTYSDQALTLSAISPYADSPITITNIAHIALQECDRIQAISDNLNNMGIKYEAGDDFVRIFPGDPKPADIQTYDDHRVAMSFCLTGLMSDGIRIINPQCCKKTFSDYFEVMDDAIKQLQEQQARSD